MIDEKYKSEEINIKSTHIHLKTDIKNADIRPVIIENRQIISDILKTRPEFGGYDPIKVISNPRILNIMTRAAITSDTGPMSSVAGSISQICLEKLIEKNTKYSLIENGGDIALKTNKKVIISVYAGNSIYSDRIGFKMDKKKDGYGICTSSGTVGPSKSFGKCDACIVFSETASISDSLATAIANSANGVDNEDIMNNSLEFAEIYDEYYDCVVLIKDDLIVKLGRMPEIVSIEDNNIKDKYDFI